jgi:hypothetical protein
MRAIYVPLPERAVDRLRELAERERRDARSQAAVLIIDGLHRAGLSVDVVTPERAAPVVARSRR